MSQEEMISRTASETAKAVAHEMRPAAEPTAPQPDFEMSPEDAEDYKILLYLESTGDPKYAGLAKIYLDYVKAHYAYQDEWLKNNPGKEYNADDEEHSQWYAQNVPDIDQTILDKGKIDMQVDERVEKIVAPKLQQIDVDKAWQNHIPEIAGNVDKNVGLLLKRSAPELAKIAMDEKGNIVFTPENIAKIDAADPIAKEIIDDITKREVEPRLLELEMSSFSDLNYKLDPAKNPIHADLRRFLRAAEREVLSAPAEHQLKDGRRFVTRDQYDSEQDKINKAKISPEQKEEQRADYNSKFWTFTVEELEDLLVDWWANEARKRIEKADSIAKRKYGTAAQPVAQPVVQPAMVTAPTPAPVPTRSNPPSISSAVDRVALPIGPTPSQKSFAEEAVDFHFR